MVRIEIGARNYLLYLLLPNERKVALLTPASRERLDGINRAFNVHTYSGAGATGYDQLHRYQHEYPTTQLVTQIWASDGYGRVLELGAASGYFTTLLARRAESVVAVELVPDMQRVLRGRCRREGLTNVTVIGTSALDISTFVPDGSIDSALIIQSLHHFHRHREIFGTLGRAVRPGGRLYLIEPHHNLRRKVRPFRKYVMQYRAREFWANEQHWATHDFVTRGELHALCKDGGFERVQISGYWIPYSRRLIRDPAQRFRVEGRLGRWPVFRHFAAILAVEGRRGSGIARQRGESLA